MPLFTFCLKDDYNSTQIVICYFLFWISLDVAIRTLFYNDSTMHKIYEDKGKYNILYQLPIIILPSLITSIITKIIEFFFSYEKKIAKKVKKKMDENEKKKEINKLIMTSKLGYACFFIVMILFILLFWYYTSSFCAVFKNTQKPLIIDTLLDYFKSIFFTIIITLVACSLRFCALKKESKCFYKAINIIEKIVD